LPQTASAEEIQNVVYEVGRREPFLTEEEGEGRKAGRLADWFNLLIRCCWVRKGPRFGLPGGLWPAEYHRYDRRALARSA
jgi:lysyl-tRNA synthetase class 1